MFPKIERSRGNRLGREIFVRKKSKGGKKRKKPKYTQSTASSFRKVKVQKRPNTTSSKSKKKKKKYKPPSRHFSEPALDLVGTSPMKLEVEKKKKSFMDDFDYDDEKLDLGEDEEEDEGENEFDDSFNLSGDNNFFLTELRRSKDKDSTEDSDFFKRKEILIDGVPLKDVQKRREENISELGTYLTELKEKKDSSGDNLVKFPKNYKQIVNVLMHKPNMSENQLQHYIDACVIDDLDPYEPIDEMNFKNDKNKEMMKIRKLDLILEELECKLDQKLKKKKQGHVVIPELPPFTM